MRNPPFSILNLRYLSELLFFGAAGHGTHRGRAAADGIYQPVKVTCADEFLVGSGHVAVVLAEASRFLDGVPFNNPIVTPEVPR